MTERRKLVGNAGYLLLLQIINYLSPLMVLPWISGILDSDNFSYVLVTISIIQFSFIITDFGFMLSATDRLARAKDSANIGTTITHIYIIKLSLVVLVCLAIFALTFVDEYKAFSNLLFLSMGVVIVQAYQPSWYFHGTGRIKQFVQYSAYAKIIYICMVLLIVKNPQNSSNVIASLLVANIFLTVVSNVAIAKQGICFSKATAREVLLELKYSSQFFWAKFLSSTYTSGVPIILGFYSIAGAAIYSASDQLYRAAQAAFGPVSQSLFPYLSKTRDLSVLKYLVFLAPIVILSIYAVWILKENIFTILFSNTVLLNESVLLCFLILIPINFISMIFGYPAFSALRKLHYANSSIYIGSFVFISIVLFLMSFSIVKAEIMALAVLFVEIVVLSLRLLWFKKYA